MSTMDVAQSPECDCRVFGSNKLQAVVLYGSFAFWCAFVTRPFRPGPSWLSRSTWLILASLDTFIMVTWDSGDSRTTTQIVGVGILLGVTCLVTFLIEMINEGDRRSADNAEKKKKLDLEQQNNTTKN
ncbi:hypothetical protein P170DRAFT_512806 [Aspergillus steynii IBT 23096]|uniref:Uncharacterized protein n=1 Tax=Aspergillus steynii IBT 23096 TaxID=1392250 RepID=A0A2I2G062_9EURO|nr:uncharacterized protein P170DRAFT_512806 [Aspergillus steynii IBT 23096]PLB46271.1 hypothetical protein P170DRAFT_512806 [Aspergillus steynii IBT 23096]